MLYERTTLKIIIGHSMVTDYSLFCAFSSTTKTIKCSFNTKKRAEITLNIRQNKCLICEENQLLTLLESDLHVGR